MLIIEDKRLRPVTTYSGDSKQTIEASQLIGELDLVINGQALMIAPTELLRKRVGEALLVPGYEKVREALDLSYISPYLDLHAIMLPIQGKISSNVDTGFYVGYYDGSLQSAKKRVEASFTHVIRPTEISMSVDSLLRKAVGERLVSEILRRQTYVGDVTHASETLYAAIQAKFDREELKYIAAKTNFRASSDISSAVVVEYLLQSRTHVKAILELIRWSQRPELEILPSEADLKVLWNEGYLQDLPGKDWTSFIYKYAAERLIKERVGEYFSHLFLESREFMLQAEYHEIQATPTVTFGLDKHLVVYDKAEIGRDDNKFIGKADRISMIGEAAPAKLVVRPYPIKESETLMRLLHSGLQAQKPVIVNLNEGGVVEDVLILPNVPGYATLTKGTMRTCVFEGFPGYAKYGETLYNRIIGIEGVKTPKFTDHGAVDGTIKMFTLV